MYPKSIYFGLNVVPIQVLWGQSIYYLGTWTVRVRVSMCPCNVVYNMDLKGDPNLENYSYTSGLTYLYRDDFQAEIYAAWVH